MLPGSLNPLADQSTSGLCVEWYKLIAVTLVNLDDMYIQTSDSEEYRSIAPRQTMFTYYRISKSHRVPVSRLTPERFTARALEQLILGQTKLEDVPPPLDLQFCHLSTVVRSSAHPPLATLVLERVYTREIDTEIMFSSDNNNKKKPP